MPPRHCATAYKWRHFNTQTFCNQDILPLQSFCHPDILQPKVYPIPPYILTLGPQVFFYWVRPACLMVGSDYTVVLQLLYFTPPSILTLVTWVHRTQAWPSANSACRLAFGQTESCSVQPLLPLVATIGPAGRSRVFFCWVRPACLMVVLDYTAPSCPTASLSYSTILAFCKLCR